jgi:hypothetical protein
VLAEVLQVHQLALARPPVLLCLQCAHTIPCEVQGRVQTRIDNIPILIDIICKWTVLLHGGVVVIITLQATGEAVLGSLAALGPEGVLKQELFAR